ncbi:hypothetical protein [Streptosporangium sp. NPDC002607]
MSTKNNRVRMPRVFRRVGGTALAGVATPGVATAAAKPAIDISGGLTQPVFSYKDAIREYVQVQSPVDSDGKKGLVRVDSIRPKETSSELKVPTWAYSSSTTARTPASTASPPPGARPQVH